MLAGVAIELAVGDHRAVRLDDTSRSRAADRMAEAEPMSRAPKLRRRWTAASIVRFGACVASDGATLNGKVVAITDGDTLTAPIGERQIKVRLVEIDAPESSQAFGDRSKRSLADLCLDKPARLIDRGTDADGRMLARVECAGVDANEEQVRRGMAWVYDQYVTDRSLYIDQNLARSASRGLWSDPNPTRPWEWRHAADGRPPTSPSSPLVGDC